MAHDKASSAQTTGWYLTARGGELTARVHPGMHLGEDASGEVSFQSSDGLVEIDIRDGTLVLRVTSDTHELEVPERGRAPTVYVDPQTRVQLSFPNNTVSIDTSSVTTGPVGDTLEIRVVQTSGDATSESRPKAASGPPIARFLRPVSVGTDETIESPNAEATDSAASEDINDAAPASAQGVSVRDILVPEVSPAELSLVTADDAQQPNEALTTAVHPVDGKVVPVGSGITRAAIFAAVLLAVFVGSTYFIFQTQTQTQTQIETPPEPEIPTVVAAEDQPGALVASPVASKEALDSAPAESQPPAESLESGNPELLAQIAALVESEELPDKAAVDFAVQSLKTLHLAYPNDPKVRQSLEILTERLASEAMLSYDGGDAIMAGTLIAQASITGVAQESVSSALIYLAAAQAAAAQRNEELAARAADAASGTGEPDVARRETRDSTVDNAQATQLELVPAFRPAPMIYPYAFVAPQASGSFGDQTRDYLEPGDAVSTNVDEMAANRLAETNASLDAEQPADLYPLSQLKLIRQQLPPYPRRAPDGVEGSVNLQLTVTETGDVGGVEIIGEAPDYFVRAAMKAVLNWKFEPVFENGKPISVRTAVRVSFRP